jgi:hypothetical protein
VKVDQCTVAGPCEHGNEPSGSMKRMEFLDQLSDFQLLKTVSSLRVSCQEQQQHGLERNEDVGLISIKKLLSVTLPK